MSEAKGDRTAHRSFDAVLVDLWGTLLPYADENEREQNLAEMARILGVEPDPFVEAWIGSISERCLGSLGSLEDTVRRFALAQGVRASADEVERAVRCRLEFARLTLDESGPVLGAVDALRRAGLRLAIVSDSTEETVRLWPQTRLSPRFEHAVFSFTERTCKPDPRMYLRALGALDLTPSRVAYVGDGGSRELTAAEGVGLTAFKYRFPDAKQDVPRFDEDVHWRGPRLADLSELVPFAPRPRREP
jgi:putative hydrolase of the HAD superfamily